MKDVFVGVIFPTLLAGLGWVVTICILDTLIGTPQTTKDFVLATIGGLGLMTGWAVFMYTILKWFDDHL